MTWVDYAILAIIGISALISIFRGLVREVLSLLAWGCAFWVAWSFMQEAAGWFGGVVSVPAARLVLAFATLFVGTLLVGGLVNLLIGKLIAGTGLSGTDRMLGMLFGVGRGVVIVAALVLAAGLTPVPQDPSWRTSLLLPRFEAAALVMRRYLPAEVAGHFRFEGQPRRPASSESL
jgi:membrane protein required for colicin V production